MGTDGSGITTLVTFMGCPLRCKYCLNDICHESIYKNSGKDLRKGVMMLSPQELYDLVKIDNIYFQTTNGGICFGGGESTLYPDFIEEFKDLCSDKWKITLETSLHCPSDVIQRLSKVVDYWFVDIKTLNPNIYKLYTGIPSEIYQHLVALKQYVPNEKITIKVPIIPGYVSKKAAKKSIKKIRYKLGFTNIVKTEYITKKE